MHESLEIQIFGGDKTAPTVVLFPPVCGLYPPLDKSFPFIAERLSREGYRVAIVCFPGQHGLPGRFSVATSCMAATRYVSALTGPHLLFGICSGGVAALAASVGSTQKSAVLCWDVHASYRYTPQYVESIARSYAVRFCPDTCLVPVQASDFVQESPADITLAFPRHSLQTTVAAQARLAALSRRIHVREVQGLGHFPGVPRGTERPFAEMIVRWANQFASTALAGPSQP
jgi:hypothetical protein